MRIFGKWAKEHVSGMAQCVPCSSEGNPCLLVPKSDNLRKHEEGQPLTTAEATTIRERARAQVIADLGLDPDLNWVSSDDSSDDDEQLEMKGLLRLQCELAQRQCKAAAISKLKEAAAAAVLGGFKSEHQIKVDHQAKFSKPSSSAAATAEPSLRSLWDADKVRSLELKTVQMKALLFLLWDGRPMIAYMALHELLSSLPMQPDSLPSLHWSYFSGWVIAAALEQVRT